VKPAKGKKVDLLLIATGSEVHLALAAAERLEGQGKSVQVVSMPSWELFEKQPEAYRNEVLPPECSARLVVEAAAPMGWERYAGPRGRVLGIERFGASAPGKVVGEKLGYTVERVLEEVRKLPA
jgi:transketolase